MPRKELDEELEVVDDTDASVEDDVTTNDEIEEAVDGTGGVPEGASKSNMMSIIMKKMGNMSSDQIAGFNKSLEKFNPDVPGADAAKNKASIAMKEAVQADLAAVFGENTELGEETLTKVKVLFESQVNATIALREAELEESFAKILAEEVENIRAELATKVDKYLDHVADLYIQENAVAIESALRADTAERFMKGLYNLFKECHMTIPEEKLDVAELLSNKVDELEEQLDVTLKSNVDLAAKVKEFEKKAVVAEKSEGLTQVQKDKVVKLAESIDFDGNLAEYSKKLDIVIESNLSDKSEKKTNLITEEIAQGDDSEGNTIVHDPAMKKYIAAIKRTVRH